MTIAFYCHFMMSLHAWLPVYRKQSQQTEAHSTNGACTQAPDGPGMEGKAKLVLPASEAPA